MTDEANAKRPTDAELSILRVLWSRGPSTVQQVQETLSEDRPIGYTTVLKLLQIMTEKGLVLRDESRRAHVYRPRDPEEQVQRRLLQNLLDKAFGGSARRLMLQALEETAASDEERAEIEALLDKIEGNDREDAP